MEDFTDYFELGIPYDCMYLDFAKIYVTGGTPGKCLNTPPPKISQPPPQKKIFNHPKNFSTPHENYSTPFAKIFQPPKIC